MHLQIKFQNGSIAVRISGNLNMANMSSLSNRIESEINEIIPDNKWLSDQVAFLIQANPILSSTDKYVSLK